MITAQTVVATVADVNNAYILVNVEETDIETLSWDKRLVLA